jgi:hypothetical protein
MELTNVTLENCTPHEVAIVTDNQEPIVIPPSGIIPRVKSTVTNLGTINGIPVMKTELGQVENMPNPKPNTIFIVSSFVAQALTHRPDVVSPDTSPSSVIRDENGLIIGVKQLQKF